MDRRKFKSMTAFLDMLWILLAGFGAMFIIAFMLIQPPAKNADVIKRAEYIVTLEWEALSSDDIDIWIMDPNGSIVCFRNKTAGFMNLEKDDLGRSNDTITDEFGNQTTVDINREVITLRGVIAGEYQVMIHVYSRVNKKGVTFAEGPPRPFTVEVIKINPYKIVYLKKGFYTSRGQEISVVRFSVGSDAGFIGYNNLPSSFIGSVGRGGSPAGLPQDYLSATASSPSTRRGV